MSDTTTSHKPRLLVLASTYPRWQGDPEPGFVHALSRRLVDRFDVTVLGPHANGAVVHGMLDGVQVQRYRYAPAALETLVNDGGIVTNLKRQPWKWLLLPGFLLAQAWATWRLIRTLRPDVIHAHWLIPQAGMVALLGLYDRRVPPYVVTSHGADLFALRAGFLQKFKRWVVRRAAAATVVSTAMRDELARIGADTSKVTVQPMGVDLAEQFTPNPHIARSANTLLFVGRLVEKKGLRHLIDALPEVHAQQPLVRLQVAGFGPELEERQAQVRRLGLQDSVDFLGAVPQSELPGLYRTAAMLVAPFVEASSGDREGLGLTLVEASGCGCPIVTTRIPAVREVFDGDWPEYIATPGDPDGLAAQILRLLQAHPQACAAVVDGLPALRAKFGYAHVAAGYADLLQGAIRPEVHESQEGAPDAR